jgi:hypothetical protein
MSKAHLTALAAALAIGAFAPRVAAQDTSSAGVARPDTSAYTVGAGVDTSARPGRVGATDTTGADSAGLKADTNATGAPRVGADTTAPGGIGADTTLPASAGDTSGMSGQYPAKPQPGSTASPSGTTSPTGTSPSSP